MLISQRLRAIESLVPNPAKEADQDQDLALDLDLAQDSVTEKSGDRHQRRSGSQTIKLMIPQFRGLIMGLRNDIRLKLQATKTMMTSFRQKIRTQREHRSSVQKAKLLLPHPRSQVRAAKKTKTLCLRIQLTEPRGGSKPN